LREYLLERRWFYGAFFLLERSCSVWGQHLRLGEPRHPDIAAFDR